MKAETEFFRLDDSCSDKTRNAIIPRLKESIDLYVTQGLPTGDFLKAVLSNDLFGAVGRADPNSLANLKNIIMYVYNAVPSVCHGSPDVFKAHVAAGAIWRNG